jgi:8-oxo-dGTP pyrophosphatase MutT (NUDIX family)
VPLFADHEGKLRVWLVRRPDNMRTHQGQVALPGGKWEKADGDLLDTALREAEEEIGLARDGASVLGVLDDCVTITGFVITPHVAWLSPSFVPIPRPDEVARAFSVRLAVFEEQPQIVSGSFAHHEVHAYRAEGETIWGATARILESLIEQISPSALEQSAG